MTNRILIVDDDLDFKSLLIRRLKVCLEDLQVEDFDNITSARKFLENLKDRSFDLVVLDQHLPDGKGVDFLNEGWFAELAVLSMSSDEAPQLPGAAVKAGAMFFLSKTQVSEDLFDPLVKGLIDRNKLVQELRRVKDQALVSDTIKTMVATLKHEINNPLGAVLGAAYLMRQGAQVTDEQLEAANLVELSGKRIKYVLEQLCQAVDVEQVNKADRTVFHVPGDKKWE